jgi:predicted acylesterase/phospholipase RssA
VKRHHHVRIGDVNSVARLARFLSDNAIGLVLAGGGARGFAHLGAAAALNQCGIAVDAIGGASFGAVVGSGLARGGDDAQTFEELWRAFSSDDPLDDYTIPIVSLVRGEHLDRLLEAYMPMDIEDLWLPFFAVSSDITENQVKVHQCGPVWRAVRASISLPAILPPVLENGHLLIDGGVLNNLPVDVMREKTRGPIVAVDLAVTRERRVKLDVVPTGSEYIKSRLLPGRIPIEAPTVSRVIMQVTTMASRKEVERARMLADIFLNPQLGDYDFLDWGKMREIIDIGYRHSLPKVQAWLRRNPRYQNHASFVAEWRHGLAS